METKHTLGPWVICSDRVSPPTIIAPGVFDICEMSGAASNEGVMADAKLIAAAPDLLEAVSIAYSHLTNPMSVQMSNEQLAKLMLDAIKKATE